MALHINAWVAVYSCINVAAIMALVYPNFASSGEIV